MTGKPTLISAATVARVADDSVLRVTPPYLVTPSAAELAARKNVRIEVHPTDLTATRPAGAAPARGAESRASLAGRLESTLLRADATPDQVRKLCREAMALSCHAVCVNPAFVATAVNGLEDSAVAVVSVCGFPLGAHAPGTKAAEARTAESQGAREIDMVLPIGWLRAGHYARVRDDIRAVREALTRSDTCLKVIIEAPLLTEDEKVAAAVICVEAGAQFVKTGTGVSGAATTGDVELIRRTVGDRIRIKAAGGIGDRDSAEAMLQAGADRIGTSRAAVILAA
jgi:deoxyribose-phosphate aldolase